MAMSAEEGIKAREAILTEEEIMDQEGQSIQEQCKTSSEDKKVIMAREAISKAKPWIEEGYPAFSKWMASADNFTILRRFEALNIRVLLKLQDKVMEAEAELLKLDEQARSLEIRSDIIRHDPYKERRLPLEKVQKALLQYSLSS
jgi:hypothetical protein